MGEIFNYTHMSQTPEQKENLDRALFDLIGENYDEFVKNQTEKIKRENKKRGQTLEQKINAAKTAAELIGEDPTEFIEELKKKEKEIKKNIISIPKKLIVKGRPELSVFPLNILFNANSDYKEIIYSEYQPNFCSYHKTDGVKFLRYHNVKDYRYFVEIVYEEKEKRYIGYRAIGDDLKYTTYHNDWNMFFVHFLYNGILEDEPYSCVQKND